VPHPEEGAPHADVHHPLVLLFRGGDGRSGHAHARVVDHNVEAAPLGDRPADERFDITVPRHVGFSNKGFAVYLVGDAFGRLLVHVGEDEEGALGGEAKGYGPTDPAPRAGDYRPLARETFHGTPGRFLRQRERPV